MRVVLLPGLAGVVVGGYPLPRSSCYSMVLQRVMEFSLLLAASNSIAMRYVCMLHTRVGRWWVFTVADDTGKGCFRCLFVSAPFGSGPVPLFIGINY